LINLNFTKNTNINEFQVEFAVKWLSKEGERLEQAILEKTTN
jgi:hypothetical protein